MDKKQHLKLGGTSDLCYRWLYSCDKSFEDSTELGGFDVFSHDLLCSLLKESATEVQYPTGESYDE